MPKKTKRKATQPQLPGVLDQVRARELQDHRKALRHQQRVRALNRQLTSAIRSADQSTVALFAFLGEHRAVLRARSKQGELVEP